MSFHIAEVNIARMKGPLDDPVMSEFAAGLDEINALADRSPGFVWRLAAPGGGAPAAYLRPYADNRILFNLSVWESIEQLKDYTYRSAHAEVFRKRAAWFDRFEGAQVAMWWVPVGHRPSVDEAKKRLEHLDRHGVSQFAFTFKSVMPPDPQFLAALDWDSFLPCPA